MIQNVQMDIIIYIICGCYNRMAACRLLMTIGWPVWLLSRVLIQSERKDYLV